MGNLGDLPSVTCADVAFLKVSANFYTAFKASISGGGKGDAGNGFLSASVISMASFIASYFDDKDSNWDFCGGNSTVSLTRSAAVLVTYIFQHQ